MRIGPITGIYPALAVLALTGALAGCGQHTLAAIGSPAASRASHASHTAATAPGAARSHGPGPNTAANPAPASPAASHGQRLPLPANGLYLDAPDGSPHYVIALARSGPHAVHGSVNYFYQDGRIDAVGSYTGRLSSDRRLTIVFGNGQALSGTYRPGQLILTSCASVLNRATGHSDCQFLYHGHTP